MSADWCRPSAVLQSMADALSTHEPQDPTSDLCSSHEALALFTHACMASSGFRLLGFDEEKTREAECHELAPRLPSNWNASFNTYSFVYTHQESTLRFVIKIDRMGGKADIRGLALQDDRIARSEITIRDFISNSTLPVRITMRQNGTEDRSDLVDKLQNLFVSESSIKELAYLIAKNIIQELLPVLRKSSLRESGDEVSPDDAAVAEDVREAARRPPRRPVTPDLMPEPAKPHPFDDPLSAIPQRPPVPHGDFPPPDFEDPYDINRPPGPPSHFAPGYRPFGDIGADDLNPPAIGPTDPLRPGRGMPGGVGEARGMYPSIPDLGGWGRQPGIGGGSLGFDEQVPPGARYDPIGPGGHPRWGGGRPGSGNPSFGHRQFGGGFDGGDII
ncbi:PI31 proteasome regulator N-terminal-domain-containing protein [Xylaria bambusicola]|uniref:PI31 proteasome regulator N-terminal-domain-containing protein n=1 Tax=Xylaria bambusicola TaxID=326684 RepID=UPI00200838F8|nr:PI31 proteasome regulator N-terminal-domain-containing protein [Xylaria bambusicola]KAI0523640.1 PI31 proteasome regulator N-terminal-domain-containing protein [Xylaria bambusicola]